MTKALRLSAVSPVSPSFFPHGGGEWVEACAPGGLNRDGQETVPAASSAGAVDCVLSEKDKELVRVRGLRGQAPSWSLRADVGDNGMSRQVWIRLALGTKIPDTRENFFTPRAEQLLCRFHPFSI